MGSALAVVARPGRFAAENGFADVGLGTLGEEHADDSLRMLSQRQMGTAPTADDLRLRVKVLSNFHHVPTRGVPMSATSAPVSRGSDRSASDRSPAGYESVRRLSTETKAAFKTTEFVAFLAVVAGILISAAVVNATSTHHDPFNAAQAWLYAAIVTVGYMVSRGLAKSGSKQHYDER